MPRVGGIEEDPAHELGIVQILPDSRKVGAKGVPAYLGKILDDCRHVDGLIGMYGDGQDP